MNYNHPERNDGTKAVKAVCAVVFVAFAFLWLYCFQSDVMYVAQHVLSGGQTRYNRFWGALILTVVLWLLQLLVYGLLRLKKRAHALTWFPSMLLLAVITSVNDDIDLRFSLGHWVWIVPLLLLLWGSGVWVARMVQPYESGNASGFFSRQMCINLLTTVLMIGGVSVCGNTNAVYHFRTHAEMALLDGDYDEALRVGSQSQETDSCLMMLRMYALSRKSELGERLFKYPMLASSDAMLPTMPHTRLQVYYIDSLYRHLGAIPRKEMRPMDYLQTIIRSGQAKAPAADYLLCGYLLDCDLDSFANHLERYYTVNDSLPRHYREALVLYNHKRSNPRIVYDDAVLDVDYDDLRQMMASCSSPNEWKGRLTEDYAGSYWLFYYMNKR